MITTAKVTIEVDVDIGQSWSPDCKIEQVYKQASEQAQRIINGLLAKNPRTNVKWANVYAIHIKMVPD